jgi:hypothetical protein
MIDDELSHEARLDGLRRSLRALANAGASQPSLFPERTPDDLAQDFDRWSSLVYETDAAGLAEPQRSSLAAIAAKLETMSRDGAELDAEMWTPSAIATSTDWSDVRQLAAAALDAFEWSDPSPADAPAPLD